MNIHSGCVNETFDDSNESNFLKYFIFVPLLKGLKLTESRRKIWLKAAVVGSLWAGLEIVVGSFLHNIHMPFAGTILGFFSLSLLIAFYQKWPDKGLIIRAAILAALMRSLSPSAIIIGPMVGIFLQGFFMEYSIRILGKNKIAFFTGALLTLSSNLFQKVVSLLIFYGFDIVVVIKNMYFYLLKQLHMPQLNPYLLLFSILTLYAVAAFLATILGVKAGKKALQESQKTLAVEFSKNQQLFVNPSHQKYATGWLILHIVAIIGGLFMLSYAPYYIAIAIVIAYMLFVRIKYPNSFRRIAQPKFWIQLLILVVFAGIFFNGFQSKSLFDMQGILAGILMSFRALLLVTAFSAISFELRNPVVKAVLYKRGFSQLYVALGLAFGALPSLLEQFMKPKMLLKSPSNQIAHLLNYADHLLHTYQNEANKEQKIIILSGKQREGKTTFLKEILKLLNQNGTSFDGIIAEGMDVDGKRMGFQAIHLSSGKTYKLADRNLKSNLVFGRFKFDNQVFTDLNEQLKKSNADFIILDEIGPLELKGKAWAESLEYFLSKQQPMIWVVRKSILDEVIKYWNITQAQVFDINKYSPEKVLHAIQKLLSS